ncbi:hypothetical protein [Paraburkholderia aspalathi]|jgi:hypothetical protein|uniref:hypothetical protein n=1 Tax=Paraburkholderia aspalathi TaxID=1324617 RepID=UPI0038BAA82E
MDVMMKKIFSIALVIFLAACQGLGQTVGVGNEKFDPAWIKQHVAVGKTTQQDILGLYGDPDDKSTSATGSDSWRYRKNRSGNNVLSAVTGMIPGMSTANQAASMADVHQKQGYGDSLYFWFKNGVLTNWHN